MRASTRVVPMSGAILVVLCLALSGCGPLKQGAGKAVVMNYDQVNNFYQFEFATPIQWNNNSQKGVVAYYEGSPTVSGFWVTYIICDLRNEGSQAENFTLDLSKFYVEYQDKRYYYRPLDAATFSSLPDRFPGGASVTGPVTAKFRLDTQVGPDIDTFAKDSYDASLGYRFSIHVKQSKPGPYRIDAQLRLRYDGYPNFMNPRNQPTTVTPALLQPAKKADLLTTCRPPAS